MKNLVTIVIPCKNEEKYIGHLLTSLSQQVGIGNTRILVADADSTDTTIDIIKLYDDVLNIEVIEGGPVSVGRNEHQHPRTKCTEWSLTWHRCFVLLRLVHLQ